MNLASLHHQAAAAPVRQAHAYAGILHGAADTYILSRVVVGLYRLQGLHQACLRPHNLAVGQHLSGTNGIAVADLPGGDAHQIRHLIEQRFNGKAGLGHTEAPEGPGRRIVGIIGITVNLEIFIMIGTRGVSTRTLQHRPAQGGVSSGIGNDVSRHALDDAVFIAADGKLHLHGMALGVDQNTLRPAELALYRPFGQIGHQSRQVLDGNVLLAAKAAAHQHIFDLHLFRRQAQHRRCLMLGIVGSLVRRQDHYPVAVRKSHRTLRLQEGMLCIRRIKPPGDHMLAAGNRQGGVAALDVLVGQQVTAAVDQRCVISHGLLGRTHWCQHLILHLDHPLGLLQNLLGFCGHNTDCVAQVVCGAAHWDHSIPVLDDVAHLVLAGDILSGKHTHHARQGQSLLLVDGLDNSPGMSAADGRGVNHAIHIYVVGVLTVALDLFRHIYPVDMGAQLPLPLFRIVRQMPLPEDPCGDLHAFHDLHIASTPANIVAQGKTDFLLSRNRIHVQKALGRHHHAGNTEAALHRPRLAKAIGIGRLLKVAEAFCCKNSFPVQLIGSKNTGSGGLAVHQDGTGAAGAFAAAVFHRGEAQLIPQKTQQLLILLRCNGLAVYHKCRHSTSPSISKIRLCTLFALSLL